MKRYPLSYNPILEYYEQIQSGKVTVCDKIRKWYKHLSDKVINPTEAIITKLSEEITLLNLLKTTADIVKAKWVVSS